MDDDALEPHLILNRDLRASHVPAFAVAHLEVPDGGGHSAAWADVRRFARTFGLPSYVASRRLEIDGDELLEAVRLRASSGTIGEMQVWELRGALAVLDSRSELVENRKLIDQILDALYRRLGGQDRPLDGDPGPYEPPLGLFGASYGSGQHRFWFVTPAPVERERLFDQVAGLLLREAAETVVVSALYLYPPAYSDDRDAPPTHIFMLLLERRSSRRGTNRHVELEYDRLTRLAVSRFADSSRECWPSDDP